MKIVVVGASGATGQQLVIQLLNLGHDVKVIVRSTASFSEAIERQERLSIVEASILELTDNEMIEQVKDCDAIASCLGHNLTWKGIYGQPRRLVTDTVKRLCEAVKTNNLDKKVKFVLMNTTGNSNRDLAEPISFGQKCVIGLLRLLLPPHVDNEKAADYLRINIGQNDTNIEWAAVRPDNLIDEDGVSGYDLFPSPMRSAIFDAGKTSRINVGHFMANLIVDTSSWKQWKGKMPVIYNKQSA